MPIFGLQGQCFGAYKLLGLSAQQGVFEFVAEGQKGKRDQEVGG